MSDSSRWAAMRVGKSDMFAAPHAGADSACPWHPIQEFGRHVVRRLISAIIIILSLSACDEERAATPNLQPLSSSERAQFESPLTISGWPEPGSWPQFAHDPLHTGRSEVDLQSAHLDLVWQFRPTEHVYSYQQGYSVWSTPVVGTVDGRSVVIIGHYDRAVYAVDGVTGNQLWTYRPRGSHVFASPALGRVEDRSMVYLAAGDRTIYSLDAASGEEIWSFETASWTPTKIDSLMSSPTLFYDGTDLVLLVGVWNSDRSATKNV